MIAAWRLWVWAFAHVQHGLEIAADRANDARLFGKRRLTRLRAQAEAIALTRWRDRN